MIRIHAPAKLNLALRVLAREDTGYHQVETVFATLEFGDVVSLGLRGRGISLEMDGPNLGPPEENLVFRAARGFRELAGVEEGFEIRLEKKIPTQAGLGGGSSDAAATLRVLDSLFPGRVEEEKLLALAGSLGSDVPFFLGPTSMALAWGRGDRLFPLPPLPAAPVLLALPALGVSTPEAYRLLAEVRKGKEGGRGPMWMKEEALRDWSGMAGLAKNDFEAVLFPQFPLLARLRESMEETGARFSLLSGSGSAVFGVYQADEEVLEAKASLKAAYKDVRFVVTRTLEALPDPLGAPGVEG